MNYEVKNKLLKILKQIIITIVILIAFVFITNEIVYRIKIPDEFKSANWNGTWKSSKYKLMSGKVLTSFPSPMIENSKFKSRTLIYYNIWSMYGSGQVKIVEMDVVFGLENFKGNSESENQKLDEFEPFSSNYFTAKILFGDGQQIEYTGMKYIDKEKIIGDYVSELPSDLGVFKLSTQ